MGERASASTAGGTSLYRVKVNRSCCFLDDDFGMGGVCETEAFTGEMGELGIMERFMRSGGMAFLESRRFVFGSVRSNWRNLGTPVLALLVVRRFRPWSD